MLLTDFDLPQRTTFASKLLHYTFWTAGFRSRWKAWIDCSETRFVKYTQNLARLMVDSRFVWISSSLPSSSFFALEIFPWFENLCMMSAFDPGCCSLRQNRQGIWNWADNTFNYLPEVSNSNKNRTLTICSTFAYIKKALNVLSVCGDLIYISVIMQRLQRSREVRFISLGFATDITSFAFEGTLGISRFNHSTRLFCADILQCYPQWGSLKSDWEVQILDNFLKLCQDCLLGCLCNCKI